MDKKRDFAGSLTKRQANIDSSKDANRYGSEQANTKKRFDNIFHRKTLGEMIVKGDGNVVSLPFGGLIASEHGHLAMTL